MINVTLNNHDFQGLQWTGQNEQEVIMFVKKQCIVTPVGYVYIDDPKRGELQCNIAVPGDYILCSGDTVFCVPENVISILLTKAMPKIEPTAKREVAHAKFNHRRPSASAGIQSILPGFAKENTGTVTRESAGLH